MNRKKTTLRIDKDSSSALLNIALEKEGEKKEKSYDDKGYSYLVTLPSTVSAEQDLTLLSRRKVLLSLWYIDSTVNLNF